MTTKHFFICASALAWGLTSMLAQDRARTGAWQTTPPALPPAAAASAVPGNRSFAGKVLETMDAATYTYVQVAVGTEKLWAAAPKTAIKVGDSVTITDGMPMSNYHSQTLNRDYPMIYFAGSLLAPGTQAAGGSAHGKMPAGHPPVGRGEAKPKVDLTGIIKAKGGQTVQEIFAGKQKLAGKEVIVRGKVVKYNAQIMGKNWLHIQDGTGTEGSNDLTVTSSTPAKLGDVVLVTGKLSTDKDFGAGYKFAVILDEAKVLVE